MDLIEKRHLETPPQREVLKGFEPNEERWAIEVAGSKMSTPGTKHSSKGLVHDKMFGGKKIYLLFWRSQLEYCSKLNRAFSLRIPNF